MNYNIDSSLWGKFEDKEVYVWKLKNANGIELWFTSYGARLIKAFVPDANGKLENVTLGWETLDEYVAENGGTYYGAAVGRYGNRIGSNGTFLIDGEKYQLELNNAPSGIPCALHGGLKGFSLQVWECVEEFQDKNGVGIIFEISSPDGEGGYPGNVVMRVKYTLTNDNVWRIEYTATTDKATHISPTNHAYWNLDGIDAKTTVMDHVLKINASCITAYDAGMIPTGELRDVTNTPFDFREPTKIGEHHDDDDELIRYGAGYDINWVIDSKEDGLRHACTLSSEKSGRTIEVWTTEVGIQIYDGYYLPVRNAGVALETQHFPDTPNKPEFPSTLLKPGETLHSTTEYRFC
ncbi:MAG: galactose mutarotase [Kiritimatiellae bacterium]|nr:galactose mutarotase [Kiritimatiellia bacterium]